MRTLGSKGLRGTEVGVESKGLRGVGVGTKGLRGTGVWVGVWRKGGGGWAHLRTPPHPPAPRA